MTKPPKRNRRSKRPKSAETTAGPVLVPQKHGGALLSGGKPGNAGGGGFPASALRAQLRGSFANRVATLEQFADGAMPLKGKCPQCGHEEPATLANALPVEAKDRLRAIDMLGKYGLGETQTEVHGEASETVILALVAVRDAVLPFVPMDQREQAGNAMAEAWKRAVSE